MHKKYRVIFVCIIIFSCRPNNLLNYKHRLNYSEANSLKYDSVYTFTQSLDYNKFSTIDEEYSRVFTFIISDSAKTVSKRILDLEKDSSLVTSYYSMQSVWNWMYSSKWDEKDYRITGTIEFLDWKNRTVKVKESIVVYHSTRKDSVFYKGTVSFRLK